MSSGISDFRYDSHMGEQAELNSEQVHAERLPEPVPTIRKRNWPGLGQLESSQLLIIALTVLGLHLLGLNVLYPKFLGSRLQLNPLAVTIALLFWGWLWGAVGLILAIPITAAMKIIFDNVETLRPYGTWLGE